MLACGALGLRTGGGRLSRGGSGERGESVVRELSRGIPWVFGGMGRLLGGGDVGGEEGGEAGAVFGGVGADGHEVGGVGDAPEGGGEGGGAGGGGGFEGLHVGGGDVDVVGGLDDHEWAGDFGDEVDGAYGGEVGVGDPADHVEGEALDEGAWEAEEVELDGGGVGFVGGGGVEDDGGEVVAVDGGGGDDGGAEGDAEEDEVFGFVGVLGAELVDDLVEVVLFVVAGGDEAACGFAVGAEVDGEDVVGEGVEGGSPGEGADFGVGVAMDEECGSAEGVGVGDPPGGDGEGLVVLVADVEGEGIEGEVEVGGGEAFEDPGGFAVGHSGGLEEGAGGEVGGGGDEEGEEEEEDEEEGEGEGEDGGKPMGHFRFSIFDFRGGKANGGGGGNSKLEIRNSNQTRNSKSESRLRGCLTVCEAIVFLQTALELPVPLCLLLLVERGQRGRAARLMQAGPLREEPSCDMPEGLQAGIWLGEDQRCSITKEKSHGAQLIGGNMG